MKILVVDDDPGLRSELEASLVDLRHQVLLAASAEAALDCLDEQDTVHLVLTDVRMPGMNGIELLTQVRSRFPTVPVAVMSGHADVQIVVQALRLKAMDFLIKPFDFNLLAELVLRAESLWLGRGRRTTPRLPAHREEYRAVLPTSRDWGPQLNQHLMTLFGESLSPSERDEMRIAVSEAIQNAIIHGNLGLSSKLKETDWEAFEAKVQSLLANPVCAQREIVVEARRDQDGLHIAVEDQGSGFDPQELADPGNPESLLRASGRGLLLIRFAVDKLSWNERGNRIEIFKRLPAS